MDYFVHVWPLILARLDPLEIRAWSITCKQFYNSTKTLYFWPALIRARWNENVAVATSVDYQEKYNQDHDELVRAVEGKDSRAILTILNRGLRLSSHTLINLAVKSGLEDESIYDMFYSIGAQMDVFWLIGCHKAASFSAALRSLFKTTDINSYLVHHQTVLCYVAGTDYSDLVKLLLELGADPKLESNKMAIYYAAINRRVENVKLLVEKGADLNIRVDGKSLIETVKRLRQNCTSFDYTEMYNLLASYC